MKRICVFALACLMIFLSVPTSFGAYAKEDDFYIEYDTEKAAMLGGSEFTLNLVGGESEVAWSIQNSLIADISGDETKVVIKPKSSGVAIVTATLGDKKAYAEINVIDIANVASRGIETDSFNRAKTDVAVRFSAAGYSKFYNFVGEWSVVNEKGEAVEFVDNGESIVIPQQSSNVGTYTVKLSSSGFAPVCAELKISAYDLDTLLNRYMPIIALIVLVILIAVIIARLTSSKVGRVVKTLEKITAKTQAISEKADGMNKLNFNEKMLPISVQLKNATGNVQLLNMDNFGYYQRLQDLLMKGCETLDSAFIYNKYDDKFAKTFIDGFIEQYLKPACKLAKELYEIEKKPKQKKKLGKVEEIDLTADEGKVYSTFSKAISSVEEVLQKNIAQSEKIEPVENKKKGKK